jgi:hypothetical protein
MNKHLITSLLPAVLISLPCNGGAAPITRSIDRFHAIDPRTVKGFEADLKVISTPDAAHNRAMEVTADFKNPYSGAGFHKTFQPGSLNSKRDEALRLFIKSDTKTQVSLQMRGAYTRPDGKATYFGWPPIDCSEKWSEVILPFSELKRGQSQVKKDGAIITVPGGDPIEDWEIEQIKVLMVSTRVSTRGTSTVARFLVEDLSVVEK